MSDSAESLMFRASRAEMTLEWMWVAPSTATDLLLLGR